MKESESLVRLKARFPVYHLRKGSHNPLIDASIIHFGKNVASYKFALGKALLELADKEKTDITLEELAQPFALHIAEHFYSSAFLISIPISLSKIEPI